VNNNVKIKKKNVDFKILTQGAFEMVNNNYTDRLKHVPTCFYMHVIIDSVLEFICRSL
jgi:hypothetical protein